MDCFVAHDDEAWRQDCCCHPKIARLSKIPLQMAGIISDTMSEPDEEVGNNPFISSDILKEMKEFYKELTTSSKTVEGLYYSFELTQILKRCKTMRVVIYI
jgi:hypothetical protein